MGGVCMPYSVLVVDDDRNLQKVLQEYFAKENFVVYTASDGLAALEAVQRYKPSILLLDLMLPGLDGWEVCRRLRRMSSIPIIMLTARDDEADQLVGLEIGADDYITKPFSLREVSARVRALLRRTYGEILQPEQVLRYGALELDVAQHVLRCDGRVVELTPIEFGLLEVFMRAPQRVFNRLQLMENTHGFAFDGYERTMDAHIRNLRKKIEKDSRRPEYILTVYGIGYKFGGDSNA